MKKKTATTMITIIGLVLFAGCVQQSQQVRAKTEKQKVYTPMKVSKETPQVKHESIIDIDKNDVEQYERDQAQMSDFEKHMQARERRLKRKI